MNIPLSLYVPENLVSRDGFSRPVQRQPAHQFVPKLPIISKQCNGYREATVLIVRRTVGNVVQNIPFVDGNRDDYAPCVFLFHSKQTLHHHTLPLVRPVTAVGRALPLR